MRLVPVAALATLALVVTACGSGSGSATATSAASAAAEAASTPAASAAAEATATTQRIEVTLSDALKIEPAAMAVKAGVPVTFVVTNKGTVLHEFVLGDEQIQAEHEAEMKEAGGMTMAKDEPNAIGVEPGQTKELIFTFEAPGTTLAGCHVVGHYSAGMKAEINVD